MSFTHAPPISIQGRERRTARVKGVSVGDRWAVGEAALMSGISL